MTTTRRPVSVRAVNTVGRFVGRFGMRPGLDEDELIATARKRTGLTDLGPPETYREGLRTLLTSLEEDARLNTIGRIAARRRILDLLEVRLRLLDHRERNPQVVAEPIDRPIFVLGLPRTGTTVLYGLLASDPAMRAPLSWEVSHPFPPPRPDVDDDPRVALTDREFDRFRQIVPDIDRMHPLGARLPQECIALQAPSFASYELPSTFPIPSYWDWLFRQDLREAYTFERWFLQHLQSGYGGRHWILKSPAHMFWLDTLLEVFPDARIVQTHRDPTSVLASVSSLMVGLRSGVSDHVDPRAVGREHLEAWKWGLERAMEVRDRLPDDRVVDIQFRDTLEDPVGTVRAIYERFELEATSEVEAGVRAYLEENPRDKHGVHTYRLEDFGLDPGEVSAAFAGYRARFGVEEER